LKKKKLMLLFLFTKKRESKIIKVDKKNKSTIGFHYIIYICLVKCTQKKETATKFFF
jgi:hypothetical protein